MGLPRVPYCWQLRGSLEPWIKWSIGRSQKHLRSFSNVPRGFGCKSKIQNIHNYLTGLNRNLSKPWLSFCSECMRWFIKRCKDDPLIGSEYPFLFHPLLVLTHFLWVLMFISLNAVLGSYFHFCSDTENTGASSSVLTFCLTQSWCLFGTSSHRCTWSVHIKNFLDLMAILELCL